MLLKADKCRKEKEGNLCLHEKIISSPDPGGDIKYMEIWRGRGSMLLKANKPCKEKKETSTHREDISLPKGVR